MWELTRSLLKLYLLGEIAFYGLYIVMTRNIFILYLVSVGMDIFRISTVILLSTLISTIASLIIYKYPRIFVIKINEKNLFFHALEKLIFIPMPYTQDLLVITLYYGLANISSIFASVYVNLIIYGSFGEGDIRDITAKRNIALNITNVLGYLITLLLMYSLPQSIKFQVLFTLGGLLGVLSTASILTIRIKNIDAMKMFEQISKPEQLFSSSSFFITLLTSANLLGLVWTPFLVNVLNSPDYIVVAVNFAGSIASIISSIFWVKTPFKKLRYSLGLASLTPILSMLTPYPLLHIGISAYGGFTFTGANFLGNFLFAKYKTWLGVLRVSILLTIIANISQLLATPFGLIFRDDYTVLFTASAIIRVLSVIVAYFTIVEVAVIPEEYARTYSQLLYSNTIVGYMIIVDTVRESIILGLKIVAIATVLLILYILYRFLFFLMGIS
ncbi:MAG: hypothetical protein LZ172_02170 [Thaumarchaeota archaeon]|jgi:hypothetical protein|nr:hypothetical protein [Candidatus Geocrenenecus arthurdayi]MCL7390692.1 hypothetical protein [Candidatus Geocrenenecus arthurdayi]MCL7396036.1 hypothetical protein [Candidatus Geocrenenecus arthurdayi]MCL7403145.1 hypothetical protein [Candidatus Geocrenenecus arthurdayi]